MDDEYTIADLATLGWVRNLVNFYGAREIAGFARSKKCRGGSSAVRRDLPCTAV